MKSSFAGQVDRQTLSVAAYYPAVKERLRLWQTTDFACRLWRKDPTLWSADPSVPEIGNRLGWLALPEVMHEQAGDLTAFAEEIRGEKFRHVVLLGMGGSSLAPEVFQGTFGNTRGFPTLIVLDSTPPDAVRAVEAGIDLSRTLFLVSSKSGTTIEPLSFFRYFWKRLEQVSRPPGRHFVAITDPGTPLVQLAQERGFRRTFQAPSDVGGRYSALTVFGLAPAALIGVDVHRMLDWAQRMAEACAFCVRPSESPALVLGAVLGELALAGRNKVTFLTSGSLAALPSWIEQLIAESTGKDGKGIVPIADEPAGLPEIYGKDRLFVHLGLQGEEDAVLTKRLAALEATGHPVVRILLAEKEDIGQEFFRWEMAVASAGAILGIHPFNQPDVESAKTLARQTMETESRGRTDREAEGLSLDRTEELAQALEKGLSQVRPGDYVAIQAYLAPAAETTLALRNLRGILQGRLRLATTLGYGPRFLHSTGQLHKGGPDTGLFLQLVDDQGQDVPVPETDYSFGTLVHAQALGDYEALRRKNRRVIRIHLGRDLSAGLRQLLMAIETALSTMVKT